MRNEERMLLVAIPVFCRHNEDYEKQQGKMKSQRNYWK